MRRSWTRARHPGPNEWNTVHSLAISADCPIMVALLTREGPGRFRARMRRVLVPEPGAPEAAEVERLTRLMNEAIEDGIRERPEHWYWIHRRWKTPPPVTS